MYLFLRKRYGYLKKYVTVLYKLYKYLVNKTILFYYKIYNLKDIAMLRVAQFRYTFTYI